VPRDLEDVADYFLPPRRETAPLRQLGPPTRRTQRPAALPIRLGGNATLLAREGAAPSPIWPEAGPGPVGTEVARERADDLAGLHRAALDLAVSRAAETSDGGLVVVPVPPAWLDAPRDGHGLLRWVLIFTSPERHDLMEAYALAKRALGVGSAGRVGVTIHGVRGLAEAADAYQRVAGAAARHLGRGLSSYGLLLDDLHVYRAIVSRRPIGIEHPQSRAARALRDVARLVLEDARKLAVA
jgi:hypothetical protein